MRNREDTERTVIERIQIGSKLMIRNLFDREIFYYIRDKITVRVCNRLLVIDCDCVCYYDVINKKILLFGRE